jgi:hypothetical protein
MDEAPGVRIVRIVLIVLAVLLLISIVIWIFRPKTPDPIDTVSNEPVQYSAVRYVQEGEITAPENHNTIVITVTATSRRIEVYRGYDVGPKRSDTFPNNQASYDQFYAGLTSSGFFFEREDKNNLDRMGYCPLGIRYDYLAGNDIAIPDYDTWGASCNSKAGTFAGKSGTVKSLFTKQIPEYSKFVQGVNL